VAIHGLEAAQKKVAGLVMEANLPRVGQPKSDGYEGEGHVLLRHPNTARVEQGLKDIVSTVRVELG
jgi:hypothetical protein